MEQELHNIYIIPAVFLKYREDGNVLLNCLNGSVVETRAFEPHLIRDVKNPKYLLLGIMTGVGYMQINLCDASDFKDLFKKKWKLLIDE